MLHIILKRIPAPEPRDLVIFFPSLSFFKPVFPPLSIKKDVHFLEKVTIWEACIVEAIEIVGPSISHTGIIQQLS